jgi:hypothetical protein
MHLKRGHKNNANLNHIIEWEKTDWSYLSKGSNLNRRTFYLRIFRGSGLKVGGTAIIGVGPPI